MESNRQSAELLKQVIQFIGQQQLDVTPVNYTVCYEYFRGEHSVLGQVINESIALQQPISNELMQNWFDEFLIGTDLKSISQSQADLNKIANQLSLITFQAEQNVAQFDNSLKDCTNELSATANSSTLTSVISMLLVSTSSIQSTMAEMKQQIEDSKQEISSLQDRLEMATLEAMSDPLTGLGNRKALMKAIEEALDEAEQPESYPCLLMLDIDHFKSINDRFGHLLGDKAIKVVADILKRQTKGKDTVSRYGGEEFAVLLPEIELQNAKVVAENIRRNIENMKIKKVNKEQEAFDMTISIGVARYHTGESITDFIGRSDTALYQSKNEGRNRVTVFEN